MTTNEPVPLVVAYGAGVDSTAMLIGMRDREIRPDLILFADTGGEKASTYLYLPYIQAWLRRHDWPAVTVVRYRVVRATYRTLLEECQSKSTLPALAFGWHTCSLKWKRDAQHQFLEQWPPAVDAWENDQKVRQAVGYDDSSRDRKRRQRCTYKPGAVDDRFDLWFPLQEWGWSREDCEARIEAEGLPVPTKSACFFCPAMTKEEIRDLAICDPVQHGVALDLEAQFRSGRHYRPDGTQGLGRRLQWSTVEGSWNS